MLSGKKLNKMQMTAFKFLVDSHDADPIDVDYVCREGNIGLCLFSFVTILNVRDNVL